MFPWRSVGLWGLKDRRGSVNPYTGGVLRAAATDLRQTILHLPRCLHSTARVEHAELLMSALLRRDSSKIKQLLQTDVAHLQNDCSANRSRSDTNISLAESNLSNEFMCMHKRDIEIRDASASHSKTQCLTHSVGPLTTQSVHSTEFLEFSLQLSNQFLDLSETLLETLKQCFGSSIVG